jgi:magnesium-dependent phosphatase 1
MAEAIHPSLCMIHSGSKQTHFRAIAKNSGIAFQDMIFFDDDPWNISEVSKLGVVSILTPDGVTQQVWEQGLRIFAERTKNLKIK